jgi:ankyrin repeat protein
MKFLKTFEAKQLPKKYRLPQVNNQVNAQELFQTIRRMGLRDTKKLLNKGANVNIQNRIGKTPLINTVSSSSVGTTEQRMKMIDLLLKYGADVNIQDHNGNTAIIKAAINGLTELVFKLIEVGADLSIENLDHEDIFSYLTGEGVEEIKEKYPEEYDEYLLKKDSNRYNL